MFFLCFLIVHLETYSLSFCRVSEHGHQTNGWMTNVLGPAVEMTLALRQLFNLKHVETENLEVRYHLKLWLGGRNILALGNQYQSGDHSGEVTFLWNAYDF